MGCNPAFPAGPSRAASTFLIALASFFQVTVLTGRHPRR
jgi:hypothetical protein